MVVSTQKRYSVAEFFDFIEQPENAGRDFELIAGEIVEVVSDGYASRIAGRALRYIGGFVDDNELGRVTGADGGYLVSGKPYIPDVAYISYARQPELEQDHGYNILAPDLAVEVLSPTDLKSNFDLKVANYLAAGTVVWRIDPEAKNIFVLLPGQPSIELTEDDTLDGGQVLPGFSIKVKDLFPKRK